MTREERALRANIVAKARWMNATGLNQGTSGNISARYKDVLLITPSATPYDSMTPESIAAMPLDGEYGSWSGPLKPSTEWRFHFDITKSRPDVGAIVHTHSTYATVLAIARKEIPACHYMMAAFGGTTIRCAGYARYGTKELSDFALKALEGRNGCLLANHGMIALGANLDKAMWLAVELETIAKQYYLSLALGNPVILSDEQIAETAGGFATYGLQDAPPAKAAKRAKLRRNARRANSGQGPLQASHWRLRRTAARRLPDGRSRRSARLRGRGRWQFRCVKPKCGFVTKSRWIRRRWRFTPP